MEVKVNSPQLDVKVQDYKNLLRIQSNISNFLWISDYPSNVPMRFHLIPSIHKGRVPVWVNLSINGGFPENYLLLGTVAKQLP